MSLAAFKRLLVSYVIFLAKSPFDIKLFLLAELSHIVIYYRKIDDIFPRTAIATGCLVTEFVQLSVN